MHLDLLDEAGFRVLLLDLMSDEAAVETCSEDPIVEVAETHSRDRTPMRLNLLEWLVEGHAPDGD